MKSTEDNIEIFQSVDELVQFTATSIVRIANESVQARGRFLISLSGGETPKRLFSVLGQSPFREQMPWSKSFFFWGDERCVPLNDERNNAHVAKQILLDHVEVSPSQLFRIPVNLAPDEAAAQYEKDLLGFFKNGEQRFDLTLLGLGENAHTASLFPGTDVIHDKSIGVRSVYVKEDDMHRVSMTAPLINLSRIIIFLVTGIKKAATLRNVLKAPHNPDEYPAQLITPADGVLSWYADKNAGLLL